MIRPLACDIDLDALAAYLRTAAWIDEEWRTARFEVIDLAALESDTRRFWFLIVRPAAQMGPRYFVPLISNGSGFLTDAPQTADFDELIVRGMRSRQRFTTAHGSAIEFRGDPAWYRRPLPFKPDWSSNALSLVDLGGEACVHKTYRRLAPTINEPDLLRMLSGGGYTPDYVGDYAYIDAATSERWPLGVIYRYLEGDALDVPLSQNIRSLWPRLVPSGNVGLIVREHLRPLEAPLRAVGRFVRGFHDALGAGLTTVQPFSVASCLAALSDKLGDLEPKIMADQGLPGEVRRIAVESLAHLLRSMRRHLDRLVLDPRVGGPCHGDLHLAHLLHRVGADGVWDLRVIDLSTPCTDVAAPRFATQSPWQDLVALQRAIEYVGAEEAAGESARVLADDQTNVGRVALLSVAGVVLDGAIWSPQRTHTLLGLHSTAGVWCDHVVRLILEGYNGSAPRQDMVALWQMFYLGRLLHELFYNYAHNRPCHVAMDLRHVLMLADRVSPAKYSVLRNGL